MIVTADQASKMYIHTHLLEGDTIPVIRNLLNISHVHNAGAAFGFLSTSHPGFREIFFLSMPPIALLIILAIFRNISDRDRWTITALSGVFGGAIGNYIDRLRFRYVIDFIDFTIVYAPNSNPPGRFVYPSFNIADIAIVSGVAVLLFLEFTRSRNEKKAESESDSAPAS